MPRPLATRLPAGCSKSAAGAFDLARSNGRPPRPLPRRSGTGRAAARARGPDGHPGALRPRVARAAGGGRPPGRRRRARRPGGATPSRPAIGEVLLDELSLARRPHSRERSRRDADAAPDHGRLRARRRCVWSTTVLICARPKARRTGRSSTTSLALSGCRPSPMSTLACWLTRQPASPTWRAAKAGRRSPWRGRIPRSVWTASTSTSRPSPRLVDMRRRPRSPDASPITHATRQTRPCRAPSTWSRSSKPSTTSRSRSPCSAPAARCWHRVARCSSPTNA